MKPLPFFLCSISILLPAHAEPPKKPGSGAAWPRLAVTDATLTLDGVTQAVLERNPAIHEARAKWEATKQRVPQAAAWDDLRISASTRLGRFVDVMPNGFTDQMLSVEQMIPISGKNQSRARIATAEALGALEEVRRKELDVIAKARGSFFRLARGYALLELNRANEASLSQTLEVSRAKLEVGGQSQADVLTAENELVRIIEVRRDLERAISDEQTQLKVLMNRDPFTLLARPAPNTLDHRHEAPSVERLRALILANRPEVRMAEANVTAAKAKFELARREWIPDPMLSLQAQRYNGASQAVSEFGAGISFSVPWLNGRKYRAEEKEAENGVEAAQHALDGALTEALGLLRDQLQKIGTLHQHVESFAGRLIPNARQTVETNRTNYEGGRTGFLELVLSQRSLRDAEAMHVEHLADYRMALAELEALIGADFNATATTKRKGK